MIVPNYYVNVKDGYITSDTTGVIATYKGEPASLRITAQFQNSIYETQSDNDGNYVFSNIDSNLTYLITIYNTVDGNITSFYTKSVTTKSSNTGLIPYISIYENTKGSISGNINLDGCVGGDFYISLYSNKTKEHIGDFEINNNTYSINNLPIGGVYNIHLVDRNKLFETQVRSYRISNRADGHRYWRFTNFVTRTNTHNYIYVSTLNFGNTYNYVEDKILYKTVWNTDSDWSPKHAFDEDVNTEYSSNDTDIKTEQYLGYDFGHDVLPTTIRYAIPRNGGSGTDGQEIQTLDVEYSDDGTNWKFYKKIRMNVGEGNLDTLTYTL